MTISNPTDRACCKVDLLISTEHATSSGFFLEWFKNVA